LGGGFVINHTGNCVTVFDLKTFAVLGTVAVNGEPRGIVYDPMSKRVLVGCGIPAALVPIDPDIDLKTGKADVAIDLQGTPTGMVCDGEGMCYVNINDRDEVAVIDTREMRQVTSWPVQAWYRPEGLALDPERNRLFVGCRAHVVVLSAVDGHTLADLVVTGPNASVAQGAVQFYDGKAFTSCGHGLMVVVGQSRTGAFEVEQRAQVPGNAWPFAVDRRTGTFYMPASDVNAGRRWPGDTGIKVAVIAGK
jgi:DNA-binding beta-propeller fold protein YncE